MPGDGQTRGIVRRAYGVRGRAAERSTKSAPTAESQVKAQYPEAVCYPCASCCGCRRFHVEGIAYSKQFIGSGPTPEAAWQDAARNLKGATGAKRG